jgi:hypothetical protein
MFQLYHPPTSILERLEDTSIFAAIEQENVIDKSMRHLKLMAFWWSRIAGKCSA